MDYESLGTLALFLAAIAAFVWLMRNLPWSHTAEGRLLREQATLLNAQPSACHERGRSVDPLFDLAMKGDPQAERVCGLRDD